MKTLKNLCTNLSTALIGAVILFACEHPQDEVFNKVEIQNIAGIEQVENRGKQGILFEAKLVTALTPTDEVSNCEAPYVFFNNQEGAGTITNLGSFKTKITFCVNPANFEYVDGEGIIFMENGDELYFTIEGQVLPSDHPEYDFEFQDPFTFTGGTGQFAGASGGGRTNSLVKFLPEGGDRTDHELRGIIILP